MLAPVLYDVIIVGGGPAGLNAAVVLGRCRRKIIVFDSGNQRNKLSSGIHNYLTRDNILPADFLKLAWRELKKYSVPIKRTNIITASKTVNGNFIVTDRKGVTFQSRKLIIATGLTDRLPSLKGIKKFYGKSIFHCPYCDGWEVKDRKIAIYSENKNGVELALSLKTWSHTITLFTNGNNYLKSPGRQLLKQYNIPVVTEKIENLLGKAGKLQFILLGTKKRLPCDAMFLATGYAQHSNLAEDLGCLVSKQHVVITRKSGRTNIPGLYVVGDASWDIHLAIIAASEGAKAGVYINKQIQKEEKQQIITTQKILA